MANDGLDLARPPIPIARRAARAVLQTRLAGTNLYSQGAGGFARVPAMPALQRLAQPAQPNSPASVRLVELYSQHPAMFKQRISAQFEPKA